MSEEQVYEIDLNKKYILAFEKPVPMDELEKVSALVKKWIKDDNQPILILNSFGAKLIKVELE